MEPDLTTTIVIPCYNEEKRLAVDKLLVFLNQTLDISFLLVNDGSTDGTAQVIDDLCRRQPDRIKSCHLATNQGKGEAVRTGLLETLEGKSEVVGYWDADLSAPLAEILHLRKVLLNDQALDAVIGARVKLIGRRIERKAWRHYTGRIIGTLISMILHLPVYDTQCGAKLFKASPRLKRLLAEPFQTRWLFDVEIFARALRSFASHGNMSIMFYEEPLRAWAHMGGSKIGPADFPVILKELWRIWCGYSRKLSRTEKRSAARMAVRRSFEAGKTARASG